MGLQAEKALLLELHEKIEIERRRAEEETTRAHKEREKASAERTRLQAEREKLSEDLKNSREERTRTRLKKAVEEVVEALKQANEILQSNKLVDEKLSEENDRLRTMNTSLQVEKEDLLGRVRRLIYAYSFIFLTLSSMIAGNYLC